VYEARRDITRPPVSKREELGAIDMVSMPLATLDLVTHDAQPAFPAVHLEGHTLLSHGELAG